MTDKILECTYLYYDMSKFEKNEEVCISISKFTAIAENSSRYVYYSF